MQSWKQILFKVVALGVGSGFGFGLCILGYLWYTSRPKPWNTAAITARFSHLETHGDDDRLVFSYVLQNNTDKDYSVDASALPVAGVLTGQNSLSSLGLVKFRDQAIFIPARERLVVSLILTEYRYPQSVKPRSSDDRVALASYVDENLAGLEGFAAYDVAQRYQINFPKSWHKGRGDEKGSLTTVQEPVSNLASQTAQTDNRGEAQLKSALQYLDGNGYPRDPAAALPLLWSAVEKGNSTAETILAKQYLTGGGVARNCDQARVLLSAAAGKGNTEAMQSLSALNQTGCR